MHNGTSLKLYMDIVTDYTSLFGYCCDYSAVDLHMIDS